MDFEKIYSLMCSYKRGSLIVTTNDLLKNSLELFKGESRPDGEIYFKRHMGKNVYDLIPTGFAYLYLVSEKVHDLLRSNKVSGWNTFPVKVFDSQKNEISGYYGFSVTGRCGPIDSSKSKKVNKPAPTPYGKPYDALEGLYFLPGSWDGSEIFSPSNTAHTFVTEKVKELFEQERITNAEFEKITESENRILP